AKFASFMIPNQNFENASYKLTLNSSGADEPLAEKIINSQWIDMPISLYNLDVAINMMKFIVDDSELRRINSGSTAEKEQKFREFWKERDPSPNTEFNELMTEYYKRIDYTYSNFSSLQIPGYETDQGRAYILYGPPNNVERRFPTNSPTREIWEYQGKTLIFEATTGFGDFELISES
ncbi:MAG: GWxTD domain-containing protein, partial [Balneolaceae bacterium]